jgi:hypothetical protein
MIRRRKPLKRTATKRGTKRIPGRSAKAALRAPVRRAFVREVLTARPYCEACPAVTCQASGLIRVRHAVDVHELVRRSQGGSTLDRGNVLAVCRQCHDWIGANPREAERRGLSLPSWAGIAEYSESFSLRSNASRGFPINPSWWPPNGV